MNYVISTSYGNDSVAMMQWAYDAGLEGITVAYCDTGWAAPGWFLRIEAGEALARKLGFDVVRIKSIGMEELVRMKKGFPGNGQQFCTAHLKGIPFLRWIDEADPDMKAVVMVGKRRAESEARKNTPEYIEDSEYHGGRKLWHPLYLHNDEQRNALVLKTGMEILLHRSDECCPCVNANRADFLRITEGTKERVNNLEVEIGKPMFRPKRFNTIGIHGVIKWAKEGKNRGCFEDEESDCAGLFGCGL